MESRCVGKCVTVRAIAIFYLRSAIIEHAILSGGHGYYCYGSMGHLGLLSAIATSGIMARCAPTAALVGPSECIAKWSRLSVSGLPVKYSDKCVIWDYSHPISQGYHHRTCHLVVLARLFYQN